MDIFSVLNLIGGLSLFLFGMSVMRQAINVIMGANVGTTVTAWILSLSGISSDNIFVQLLEAFSIFAFVIAVASCSGINRDKRL